jgi:hypothetical protein
MGVEAAGMYCVHSDGTVDSKGNPAEKKNTGNWRACHYILGTYVYIHTGPLIVALL